MIDKTAKLILEDGSIFEGYSFGYEDSCSGELVFNTAMCGYPENISDPSYLGQILVLSYPLQGNYGIPEADPKAIMTYLESKTPKLNGLIITDYTELYSHWNAKESLAEYLIHAKIPAIYGIDTRSITKLIRDKGTMLAKIVFENDIEFSNPNTKNLIPEVSTKEVTVYGKGNSKKISILDLGVKHSIIRKLLQLDAEVTVLPWDYDISSCDFDGLIISNGPGNPEFATIAVNNLKKVLENNKPIWGIGMGSHLISLAIGAKIVKLKCGHRGTNQPVRIDKTDKCIITTQNHGYATDKSTLPSDWEEYFVNMNDGSNEGIKHKTKNIFSSMFYPEGDAEFLYKEFFEKIEVNKPI